MNYEAYISSAEWKQKRKKVLERDKHQCRACCSTEDLEVHHRNYERLGHEDLDDLIVFCHECHAAITEVIRRRRYSNRTITLLDNERITPIVNIEVTYGKTIIEVQDHQLGSSTAPQWANRRSLEPFFQGDEEDFLQAFQNRRRL